MLKKYEKIVKRNIDDIERESSSLDKHYLTTRYLDALADISPHEAYNEKDAKDSINHAEKIINFVMEEIKHFSEKQS